MTELWKAIVIVFAFSYWLCLGQHTDLTAAEQHANATNARLAMVREAARDTYASTESSFICGTATMQEPCQASLRWLNAELPLAQTREDRVRVAEAHLGRMRKLRKLCKYGDTAVIAYYCLSAEAVLADETGINEEEYQIRFIDRQQMYGKWTLVSAEYRGKPHKEPELLDIDFTPGLVRFTNSHEASFFEFDSTATPKFIDFFGWDVPGFYGRRAVYEITVDTLVLCWTNDDTWAWSQRNTRPTGFDTSRNKDWIVYRLKRAASDKQNTESNNEQQDQGMAIIGDKP
jgi:uncharacterized protein (TIGR03067 family)